MSKYGCLPAGGSLDQHELAEGLAKGEETAWRAFLRDYGRLIFAVVNRFASSPEERDDLFQDACLAVLKGVNTLRNPDRLASWLYRTTFRLCIDARRRRRPECCVDDPEAVHSADGLPAPFPGPDDELVRLEDVATLLDALDRLDPECRNLLHLLYIDPEEPSYRQISSRLGMPIGSIGPTRARCLEKAKRLYETLSTPGCRASVTGERDGEGYGRSGSTDPEAPSGKRRR